MADKQAQTISRLVDVSRVLDPVVYRHLFPVLGMPVSLRKVTSLGSNFVSVTDLKRIPTPHSLCVISEAIKPLQLDGQVAEFKLESKFEPVPVIWQSLQRLFQKVIKGLEGIGLRTKSTAKLFGPLFCYACAGRTGEHKHRAFPSLQLSLRAATGSLEKNMLPLLRY